MTESTPKSDSGGIYDNNNLVIALGSENSMLQECAIPTSFMFNYASRTDDEPNIV
jgi:hypothetical protein